MEFNNTISIADIISILGLTLSFITLIILFLQRRDTSRIYLSIQDQLESHKFNSNRFVEDKIVIKLLGDHFARNVNLKYNLISENIKLDGDCYKSPNSNNMITVRNCKEINNICPSETINITDSMKGAIFAILDTILTSLSTNGNTQSINKNYIAIRVKYKDINDYVYKQYFILYINILTKNTRIREFTYETNIVEVNKKKYNEKLKCKKRYNN